MAMFVKPLVIQQQIFSDACIAASACSLIDALGIPPVPTQHQVHPLVAEGMHRGMSGFAALATALQQLGLQVAATRYTPPPADLVQWVYSQAASNQGVLVSSHVQVDGQQLAHITVVYHDQGGNWFQADPGTASTASIAPASLVANYAGDVAVIA